IAGKYTDVKNLKPSVDPNGDDTKEFSVSLTIPTLQADEVWQGVNAPVRKGGAKTIFTIYFEYNGESHKVDTFESNEYSLIINSTQNEFEGYIITLKYDEEITGATITKPFERESCQYMPNQTTFVVNIYDKNFVSSYNQFIDSFSLKTNSQFSDIVINPQTPIYGQKFNISSVLTTEFGDEIPNKNVTCQYFNSDLWENISSQMSGVNGVTSFEIDTLSLSREDDLLFRLTWQGEQYILEHSQVDHQLRTTNDDGLTWSVAKKEVTPAYESEELDATAFKLNVTRGYMPSDFINPDDNQDTLRIQDISIEDQIISEPPYDVSSSLTWGLGQWNNNFTVEIESILNNLQIDLTWNSSIIQGFKFNVTYTIKGYWVENANSYYKVSYDTTPRWDLNYTLDLGDTNLDNWDLEEFHFVKTFLLILVSLRRLFRK
ncbi:unnamed protein product, partial [marine sediment metagenome]